MNDTSRHGAFELAAALVVLAFVIVAAVTDDDHVRDAHWQAAPPADLHSEQAPSLTMSAKPQAYPRITGD